MAKRTSTKRKWTAEEVQQWYLDTAAFTYANPDDLNIIVKKPRREGFTVNWANPKAYLLQCSWLIKKHNKNRTRTAAPPLFQSKGK